MDTLFPGAYGLRRSFFFFLKPSFWIKKPRNYEELYENCSNENLDFNEVIEPIPSEFRGKEAIRYDRLILIKFKLIKFKSTMPINIYFVCKENNRVICLCSHK